MSSVVLGRVESTPVSEEAWSSITPTSKDEAYVLVFGKLPQEGYFDKNVLSKLSPKSPSQVGRTLERAHVLLGFVGAALSVCSAVFPSAFSGESVAVLGPASEGKTHVLNLFNTWTCWKCGVSYNRLTVKVCPTCFINQEGRSIVS